MTALKLKDIIAILTLTSLTSAGLLFLLYIQVPSNNPETLTIVESILWSIFFILLFIYVTITCFFLQYYKLNRNIHQESSQKIAALQKTLDSNKTTDKVQRDAVIHAQAANQAKSRYLSGISHELRTPLQTILGYAQLLSTDKAIPEQHRSRIKIIETSGQHLADLIEELQDIAKIEAGKLHIQRSEVNLRELLKQVELMFKLQAKAKGIDFIVNFPKTFPHFVLADKKRTRQILINLLSNAIKFTDQGSVSFSFTYRNQVASFTIKDTGTGISEEDQERIFQPFERIDNYDQAEASGTGLGLTITHLLTKIMGGEISLDSTPSIGSCFKLSLMLPPIETPELSQKNCGNISGFKGRPRTIIVVDDHPPHRKLMKDVLKPLGFKVIEAKDAKTCMALLLSRTQQQVAVDCFFLDVSLPDINGVELAALLRKRGIQKPIMMISANDQEQPKPTNSDANYDCYMIKPINVQILLSQLGSLLNIEWIYTHSVTSEEQNPAYKPIPRHPYIDQLIRYADIGYSKGFCDQLSLAAQENILSPALARHLYQLVKEVRFDKISLVLNS